MVPVAQKEQARAQPTCEERQAVRRKRYNGGRREESG